MYEINKTNLFLKWYNNLKDKKLQLTITRGIERIKIDGYFGKTYPIKGLNDISEIKIEMGAGIGCILMFIFKIMRFGF
ncbi:MAG: hypothetical protein LBP40_02885 [Campylobacteraceae bacterium]|jgi:putative component of toxin-antitoxin plasmid stabilization module|nr:hypothetical protein [Campylobacteraceae bacterium]